ncbi:MAG: hypothetical protein RR578_01290 [Bacilli bacterium]
MKKLPLFYENIPNGDCKIYNNLLVIKTSPKADIWISSHLNIILDESFNCNFGDYAPYDMNYYDNILSINKVNKPSPEFIIEKIIEKINADKYIVLLLNIERMLEYEDTFTEKFRHILIYGYDINENHVICALIKNGKLSETEISFDSIIHAYSDIYEQHPSDIIPILNRQNNFYDITELTIKDNYKNDNWIYDMMNKLKHEINGKQIIEKVYSEDKTINLTRTMYTGLACIDYLQLYLNKKKSFNAFDQFELNKLSETFKKLHDHRNIILSSMKYFMDAVGATNNINLQDSINNYQNHISTMQIAYMLLSKYAQTNKESLYQNIINKISNQYQLEYQDLQLFIHSMSEYCL